MNAFLHSVLHFRFTSPPVAFQFQCFHLLPGRCCPYLFCNAKYQYLELSPDCISQSLTPFYKSSLILNIENVSASKKVTANGSIESKSTNNNYEIILNNQNGSEVKKSKKENAPDIISKSMFNQPAKKAGI